MTISAPFFHFASFRRVSARTRRARHLTGPYGPLSSRPARPYPSRLGELRPLLLYAPPPTHLRTPVFFSHVSPLFSPPPYLHRTQFEPRASTP